jgi:hypothetical protein
VLTRADKAGSSVKHAVTDFALLFPAALDPEQANAVIASLGKRGVLLREVKQGMYTTSTRFETLMQLAEKSRLRRPTVNGLLVPFSMAAQDEFCNVQDESKFFTSAERLVLLKPVVMNDPEVLKCKIRVFPTVRSAGRPPGIC